VSRSLLYEAMACGALHSFRVGTARLIFTDELRSWLEREAARTGGSRMPASEKQQVRADAAVTAGASASEHSVNRSAGLSAPRRSIGFSNRARERHAAKPTSTTAPVTNYEGVTTLD
jgi:hypothetical protein